MSVNKVILVGNVGKDPDVRHLDNDRTVANFSLATRESYRDRQGQKQELTEWHSIELWDDLARTAEKFVRKGKLIYLEGKIRTNSWNDKDTGQERTTKIIRCNVMTFLNSGGGQAQREQGDSNTENSESLSNSDDADEHAF